MPKIMFTKVSITLLIIWIVPVLIINIGHFISQTFKKIKKLLKSIIFKKGNTKNKKEESMIKIKTFEPQKPETYTPAYRNLKKEIIYKKQWNTIYIEDNWEKFKSLFSERIWWFDLV